MSLTHVGSTLPVGLDYYCLELDVTAKQQAECQFAFFYEVEVQNVLLRYVLYDILVCAHCPNRPLQYKYKNLYTF